jgi:hypothetical protein
MIRTPDRTLVLLLCLSAFAWMPLAAPGYFLNAHDAKHSLFFLEAFDEAVRGGSWWPTWGPNFAFGYGYPLWIFYAPLTYFVAEKFHLLGASITASMKLVDLFATIAATLSMYAWARNHFGKQASAFAAIVYTFAPYHLLDLYVRSAVAEYATFVFFPLLLWRWEILLHTPSRRSAILAALVTAGLLLTHHGAAFIFAPLLAAYLLFLLVRLHFSRPRARIVQFRAPRWASQEASPPHQSIRRIRYSLFAGLLALGLSAIFWLPVLLEQKYIVVEQWTSVAYNYQQHFVYLNQFFSPFWGYGYSGEGLADGMSFQLGLIPVVGGVVALIGTLSSARGIAGRRATVVFFLAAAAIVVLLMSPASGPFWQAAPVAALVQFPWRLLSLSTIALAWLSGAALEALFSARRTAEDRLDPAAALMMLVAVLAGFNYTLPQYTERSTQAESARAAVDFELVSYRDRTGYMTWASEQPRTSPMVEEYVTSKPLTRAVVLRGTAQLDPLHDGGEVHSVRVKSQTQSTIQFRVYYFPGWSARIDGQPVPLWPAGPQALITLDVPPGEHEVEIQLQDTNIRALAKLISLLSVLAIVTWLVIGQLRERGIVRWKPNVS